MGVGRGANWCFGHAGPGEFNSRVIERGTNHFVVEYETGARHYYQLQPHNYHIVSSPLSDPSQGDRLDLPDPEDPPDGRDLRRMSPGSSPAASSRTATSMAFSAVFTTS